MTISFNVGGMGCQSCVMAVEKAIKALDPGARVDVDLAAARVEVADTTQSRDALAQAIERAGYDLLD